MVYFDRPARRSGGAHVQPLAQLFTVKHRAPRVGRNPRTGASVPVDEKFVPFFKTGKELRERLNMGAA